MKPILLMITLLLAGAAPASAQRSTRETDLQDGAGKQVGRVMIRETGGVIRIQVNVHDLAPGRHGMHIHQNGSCEPPGFESAGPHYNPHGREHGRRSPRGPHLGDLGNISVARNGRGSRVVTIRDTETRKGIVSFLGEGRAIVVHAGPDDEVTDPSGNSGARIACGVVR